MICHFGGDLYPGPGCIAEKIELSFLKPVYFDETIRAVCTILEVNLKRKRIKFGMECFNEKGEKVVEGSAIGLPTQQEVSNLPIGAVRHCNPVDPISKK
jgi:3-hydroxybutyryl-CoA dehydratase